MQICRIDELQSFGRILHSGDVPGRARCCLDTEREEGIGRPWPGLGAYMGVIAGTITISNDDHSWHHAETTIMAAKWCRSKR